MQIILILILGGLFFMRKIDDSMYDPIYKSFGEEYSIDWKILKSLAIIESRERANAVNPNDPSYGLMQILCSKPKNHTDGNYTCDNKFYIDPWPVTRDDLFTPETNIKIGAQIAAWNLKVYGYPRGIAIYNNWSARHSPAHGPFPNQDYVDRFMAVYEGMKNE